MTMGALHAGHLTLVEAAKAVADQVLVTIFVNPLQFGPNEDLAAYPRTLADDLAALAPLGVAGVFAPDRNQVYPAAGTEVTVSAGQMGTVFEGATRPGHFDGVLTVVAKLLHLVQPDVAVFGRKDAQQLALIERMVADLNFPVTVLPVATVRDPDGLALSSRNRYLSTSERTQALALNHALHAGVAAQTEGADAVTAAAQAVLADANGVKLDYLALLDPRTFTEADPGFTGAAVLAVAAWVGATRLIDNVPVTVGHIPGP